MKPHGWKWRAHMHNPFAQPKLPMQRSFFGEADVLAMLDMALEDLALGSMRSVGKPPVLRIIYEDADNAEMNTRIARLQSVGSFTYETERLADINWAAKMQEDFPAFRVGQFYVHGSHVVGGIPPNTHALAIDAAAAFGTGEHATTASCLLALQDIRRNTKSAKRILDMGCGTAILALGAAKLWPHARLDAVDNDLAAVHVAQHNIKANQLGARITAWRSDGPNHRKLMQHAPYDIIIANILALPLMNMAHTLSALLAHGGTLILSGLLESQIRMVLGSYEMQGLRLHIHYLRDGWAALTLKKA